MVNFNKWGTNKEKYPVKIIDGKAYKTCSKCLKEQEVFEFPLKNKFGTNRQSICKSCNKLLYSNRGKNRNI